MASNGPLDLLVRNTSAVWTVDETRSPSDAVIPSGVIGVRAGRVAFLGAESDLPAGAVSASTEVLDAGGGFVGPGFVDAHTHLVFGGERSKEFELRNQGKTYLEIAAAGGGIANTLKATRAATEAELVAGALPRLRRLLEWGVTHAEVKSGYGLNLEDERKMLLAVRALRSKQPISLTATLLCAHAVPPEYKERRAEYVALCADEIIPTLAREGLAEFCDAFVEEGAFTPEEGRRVMESAKRHGLHLRLHVDQLKANGRGAELSASLGAKCADHLEEISDDGIRALAASGTAGVLIPVSTLFLRQTRYAPGRRLLDAGVTLGLGTNVNPGSAMSENVALTLGLACLQNGLTGEEAYTAFTRGSARALALADAGKLSVGGPADLVVFSCRHPSHLPYHLGINHAAVVVKGGNVVHRNPVMPTCE